MNPSFPVYVISKGRWESRLTARSLEAMGVPYSIVVEEQEAEEYAKVCKGTILVLDRQYQRDYDACMQLEPGQSKGSGPARNFVWDHSIANGALCHWIMDDNIDGFFYRQATRARIAVTDGTILRCMEDFTLRYKNVSMSGPNYKMFAITSNRIPPFVANTRIYSCLLIRNDVPFRWRGRYNEDTDLSLRMLKAGWCTIRFGAFLQGKVATQSLKGGNTDEIYKDGTLAKSQMIVDLHPDVARLAWKYNRAHHHIDYRKAFAGNRLVLKPDADIQAGVDNYGMRLVRV